MFVNSSGVYDKVRGLDFNQIPQITDRTLEIYKNHSDDLHKPENTSFCFQNQVRNLNRLNNILEKAEK